MRKSIKVLIVATLLAALGLASVFGQGNHSYDISGMDTSVSACTDFYHFANGGWLKANPIPAAFPAWGVANVLNEKNREVLHQILEAAAKNTDAKKGSNEQKVGDYYASCMDEAKIEAEGLQSLTPVLDQISKISDQKSLQALIAHLHSVGAEALFNSGANQDFKNSSEVIMGLFQGGLGLPDRDYYIKTVDRSKTIRGEYLKHVGKMFELMGDDTAKSAVQAQVVMAIETKLAEASKTRVELRDPEKLYNRMSVAKLSELYPTFDWVTYFQKIGLTQKTDVNVQRRISSKRWTNS